MTTFEAFFGFTGTPFSRDIAVNQLLETESGKEMLGRLNYVARTRAFGIFTGDTGTGKTTVIRKFSQGLDANRYHVLYISDSVLTPRNFTGRPCTSWVMSRDSTGVTPNGSCKRRWPS